MSLINKSGDRDALTADTTNVAKTTGLAALLTSVVAPVVSAFTAIEVNDPAVKITIIGATGLVLAAAAIAWAIVAAADLRARAAGEAAKATATSTRDDTVEVAGAAKLREAGAVVEGCLEVLKRRPNSAAAALSADLKEVRSHLETAQEQRGGDSSVVATCIDMASYLIAELPPHLSREKDRQAIQAGLVGLQMNIVRAAVFSGQV